eukprot:352863-Chlamydomonas_euryale.AAC.2
MHVVLVRTVPYPRAYRPCPHPYRPLSSCVPSPILVRTVPVLIRTVPYPHAYRPLSSCVPSLSSS